ncbi:MAG: hypothetical protein KDD84_23355, partial [Caldilineaceae bacterium]|nr:hypothetical protein [Caldilineaceae bacterium]
PGLAILRGAFAAPATAIITNAGLEASPVVARLTESSACAFDVLRECYVDASTAPFVDPVRVLYTALQTGVSGALMALTTEVLVHRPRQNREDDVDFRP